MCTSYTHMNKKTTTPKFAILASDVVILTLHQNVLKFLAVRTKSPDFPESWSLPGGLVKSNESLDTSARRFFTDFLEVSSDSVHFEQLASFGDPRRDPSGRVVSVAYLALVPQEAATLKTTPQYQEITWFPLKNLPEMAYDHKEILAAGLKRLQGKLEYTNIIYSLMPKAFTLTDLQSAYETILNKSFDKRNFRKKLKALKLVKKLPKKIAHGAHRPAQLYTFTSTSLQPTQIL